MLFMKLYTSLVVLLATICLLAIEATSYQVSSQMRKGPLTKLNAWTMPKPMHKNPFDTFKPSSFSATWYDDHNPTARKVVYNDYDQDELYNFVVSFKSDDWISPPYEPEVPHIKDGKAQRPLKLLAGKLYRRWKNSKN